ncbi:MAG TPA: hypothetical protein VMX17_04695 [Candidatus Glassbacteria bacterium]|nr:hypothetical protein [Candidatus Glassbacteria bacterium]
MKAYIVVHIGNAPEEDLICVRGIDEMKRRVFIRKKKAKTFCKKLQEYYDSDDPDNLYEFQIEKVKLT